ncbi:hypothetical protein LX36DRAFT_480960 [Colletotrichum falcatum]|nr:hypothetical protein LX36DRAFT_480960 [Colletotrichum falcatum]
MYLRLQPSRWVDGWVGCCAFALGCAVQKSLTSVQDLGAPCTVMPSAVASACYRNSATQMVQTTHTVHGRRGGLASSLWKKEKGGKVLVIQVGYA